MASSIKLTSLVTIPPLLALLTVLGTLGYTYFFASVDLTLPLYPGAEQMEMYSSSSGSGYYYFFRTPDQPDAVVEFYKVALPTSTLYRQGPQLIGLPSTGTFVRPPYMPSSKTYAPYAVDFRCNPKAQFQEKLQTLRGDFRISLTGTKGENGATYFEISVLPFTDFYKWSCDRI